MSKQKLSKRDLKRIYKLSDKLGDIMLKYVEYDDIELVTGQTLQNHLSNAYLELNAIILSLL